jgi:hypothetical protein
MRKSFPKDSVRFQIHIYLILETRNENVPITATRPVPAPFPNRNSITMRTPSSTLESVLGVALWSFGTRTFPRGLTGRPDRELAALDPLPPEGARLKDLPEAMLATIPAISHACYPR